MDFQTLYYGKLRTRERGSRFPTADGQEKEEAKASSEQVAKYNHKKEREYLEQEFKQYKERFESHPRVDKSIKKEEVVRDDEYYEKMFASSTAGFNSRQQQSIGFNKFIFAMLLIIWVIAIISFYLFFVSLGSSCAAQLNS